ncbi:MAG TPA: hypothetical protein VIF62_29635 [Labilithrix sp.]
MNWLGIDLRGFVGAMVGCVLGALLFVWLRARGVDLPPLVGLAAGFGAMAASRYASTTRGLVIGSIAVWACAIAEIRATPIGGLFSDIVSFHERLGALRLLGYVGCAVLAILLGSRGLWAAPDQNKGAARR